MIKPVGGLELLTLERDGLRRLAGPLVVERIPKAFELLIHVSGNQVVGRDACHGPSRQAAVGGNEV